MPAESLLGFIVLIVLASAVLTTRHKRAAVTRELADGWGAGGHAHTMDEDEMTALRRCYAEMPKTETAFAWVDGVTWNDLDMDAVFQHLNRTQSGVGEEALYRMLHAIDASGGDLERRDRWMNALRDDGEARMDLQRRLRTLGREHDHGAFAFLKDPQASKPAHAWAYYALAGVPFMFIVLGFSTCSGFWASCYRFWLTPSCITAPRRSGCGSLRPSATWRRCCASGGALTAFPSKGLRTALKS